MRLACGVRLGPYEILAVLGAGGMGDVYTARDTRLDRVVAIKVLRPRPGVDISDQALGEARAAARVNHPHIATLYDVVEGAVVDGAPLPPFLVMEYVDGRPLSDVVSEGPMPIDRALDVAIQLAAALAAAHRAGIIHRDIKPANVMLTRDGAVKLLDLGIARVLLTGSAVTTAIALDVAAPMDVRGTPAYMSPEQFSGRSPDARSDVYSAGVVLYELLTGRRPFDAPDLGTLAVLVTTRPAPRPSSVRASLPAVVDDVVARAMAINPVDRFGGAVALRDALVAARAGQAQAPRSRLRRAVPLAAAALIAIAAVWWGLRGTPHKRAPIAVLPALSGGDELVNAFGTGLASTLADNLASVHGLTVIAPAAAGEAYRGARRDLAAAARDLGAGYVVDLRVSGSAAQIHVDGALVETGQPTPLWRRSYDGGPLDVERWVSDQIASAIEGARVFPQRLTADERARLRRLPTSDAQAFAAYAQGQVRLEAARGAPDVQAAIASLQTAIGRDPGFALARAALSEACGRMYSYTRDPSWVERAATEANQALALDPERAQVHASLADVYRTTGRLDEARRHAEEAARLSPDSDEAHRLLGLILAESDSVDRGVAELKRAVELRPDYARNQYALGYVLYRAARYRQAIDPFRAAVRLRPSASNYQSLGTALYASGLVEEAIGNFTHAIQLAKDPLAYANLAFAYYMAGKYQEALSNWQIADSFPKGATPSMSRNIGDAYERLGDRDKARAAYENAIARAQPLLKVNPTDVDQIAIIAVCEAKLGRDDEAALRSAEALALRPADKDVLFKAAVVDALGGRVDEAFRHLADALAKGYPAAFAQGDFDLQRLRADPRFAPLVAQHAQ